MNRKALTQATGVFECVYVVCAFDTIVCLYTILSLRVFQNFKSPAITKLIDEAEELKT